MDSRLIGKVISRRFRIEDVLGRGGMAIVYRAFDYKTNQLVALKVLREEYENDPEYKARFKREAEVCKKLNHPNVVNMIDAGVVGGISYIAMEYVDGPTLKDLIGERGRMEQADAVHCALQVLAALSHAHQRGIVHRDVKPQNVMISRNGQVKIGDFGIAGMADTQTLTTDGDVMGSVHYFSPEQAKGIKATAASDLYSVGIILYEMLAGHVPFEGETSVSVAMMHLMETPKPIEEEADVCRAVELIVKKALEKQPQDRYQSAELMIRDLRRALRHPDGDFMQIRIEQEKKRKKRRTDQEHGEKAGGAAVRVLTAIAALVCVGLIIGTGISIYRAMFVLTKMPDLAGVDTQTAERMVDTAGLLPQLSYAYSDMPEGYVAAQSPKAGEQVRRGDTVSVTISKGSNMLSVPRFIGMTQEEAIAAITAQGLVLGDIIIEPSEQQRGTVVGQTPEASASAQIGSRIDLTVSGGRVVVPMLVGQREEEALSRIATLGLSCGMITYENVTDARQDGVVLAQSLEEFAQVLPGSVVEISVGFYDKRKYSASVKVKVDVPQEGVSVRVTLVGADGKESDMYAATHTEPGQIELDVLLRSEQSGVATWRLYLDGGFRSEATAVLQ